MSDDTPNDGDEPEVYEELPPDNVVQLIPREKSDAAIARLAEVDPTEYEQVRLEEANRLGFRVDFLDKEVKKLRPRRDEEDGGLGLYEPEPWPEEVDGDDLLGQTRQAVLRHVVMSQSQAAIVALWVLHTHAFECWRHTPRLGVTAPEKGCGKSTLLDVLAELVPRAVKTENMSTAVMFRVVDGHCPVLLIDEFDTFLRGNEELRGALNAGHARGGRHLRCEGDDNEVRAFKTFAPAALAGIGNLPSTLADRSIPILLQKRKQDEPMEGLTEHHIAKLNELAQQAARWVTDNRQNLVAARPELPTGMFNRDADNARPLLSIAEVAGADWPELARDAVSMAIAGAGDETESIGVQLLADIRNVFVEERLSTIMLLDRLYALDGRPWAEYGRKEKPISASQLARLLKRYGTRPGPIRVGGEVVKGYQLSAFDNGFSRYLPPQTVTELQPAENSQKSDIPIGYGVTAQEAPKPAPSNDCNRVTAENPQISDAPPVDGDLEERAAIIEHDGGDVA